MHHLEEDYLQLSGLQHFLYCPKQWALIHIEQVWADNARTVKGSLFHRNADNPELVEKRKTKIIRRSVRVSSPSLGVSGICDVVEFEYIDGLEEPICRYPVEYKVGRNKMGLEDKVQLCGEAMCLEEIYGVEIPYAYLYYGMERRRTKVVLDEELRQITSETAKQMHECMRNGTVPSVLFSSKCRNCSLIELCMPPKDRNPNVRRYLDDVVAD